MNTLRGTRMASPPIWHNSTQVVCLWVSGWPWLGVAKYFDAETRKRTWGTWALGSLPPNVNKQTLDRQTAKKLPSHGTTYTATNSPK